MGVCGGVPVSQIEIRTNIERGIGEFVFTSFNNYVEIVCKLLSVQLLHSLVFKGRLVYSQNILCALKGNCQFIIPNSEFDRVTPYSTRKSLTIVPLCVVPEGKDDLLRICMHFERQSIVQKIS